MVLRLRNRRWISLPQILPCSFSSSFPWTLPSELFCFQILPAPFDIVHVSFLFVIPQLSVKCHFLGNAPHPGEQSIPSIIVSLRIIQLLHITNYNNNPNIYLHNHLSNFCFSHQKKMLYEGNNLLA